MAAQRRTGSLMPRHESALDGFGVYQLLASQTQVIPAGSPERRLMLAVLEDALRILSTSASHARRALRVETLLWVRSDDITWVFSFRNICDHLELDREWLRARINRLVWPTPPRDGARAARGLGA